MVCTLQVFVPFRLTIQLMFRKLYIYRGVNMSLPIVRSLFAIGNAAAQRFAT